MGPRVRLVFAIAVSTVLLPMSINAQRLEQAVKVTEGSVHYQNIETAIKFLRDHGEGAAADQIQEDLEDGDIYVDPAVKVNGETSMYNNISLSPGVAGNDMPVNRNIPLDPVKDFKQVMELARTLYHENYHAHDQNLTEFVGENRREYGAWMATIFEMGKWIDAERAQFDANLNPRKTMTRQQQIDELNKLKIKAQVVVDYQGSFQENDFFGGNDQQWVTQNNTYWQNQVGVIETKVGTLVGGGNKPATGSGTPTTATTGGGTATPPKTGPPPAAAPPEVTVTVTVPCAPCQKIADQIRDAKARLNALNENAAKAEQAVTKNQQRIADLQKRVGNLQAQLERAAGTGGSSYDPATGQTVDAYDQGNGTVKVTTKDAAGNVLDEHVRDSSARKADINRQIDEANADIGKAQAETARLAQAAATAKKLVNDMAALLNQLVAELEDCIKKYCSNVPTAAALNLLGLPYRDLKTLGDPLSFNPPYTGGRNDGFQLMMIEIRVANADGIVVPGRAGTTSRGARHESNRGPLGVLPSLMSWLRPRPAFLSSRETSTPWSPPAEVQPRRAARPSPVQMLLTSLGQSTGEAFDLQIFNPGGKPLKLAAEALVVEPLKDEAKKQLQSAAQRLLASGSPVTAKVNGYCMEFLKAPPSLGTVFKIASPELQQRFAPMRQIMDASRRVQQLGQLRPDSNPDGYFHSIRQWAMWTVEQKLNDKTFANAFIEHTKKAVTAQKQPWSNDTENVIRKAAPNRWNDIQKVLSAAGVPLAR
jgi:hypothetical protein